MCRDEDGLVFADWFAGGSCFLLCGGPSLKDIDLARLSSRGVLTFAVNNAATVSRPNLWTGVDDPGNFADCIWRDPAILKFVPEEHASKTFRSRDENGQFVDGTVRVQELPSVFYYKRNARFDVDTWLTESTFNMGCEDDVADQDGNVGVRSVMLPALKLLYVLGITQVYLLGCDFHMSYSQENYAFAQQRNRREVRRNNFLFRVIARRLELLRPRFDAAGFRVFNCTAGSDLKAFPYVPFEAAMEQVLADMPTSTNTDGWYQRRGKAD